MSKMTPLLLAIALSAPIAGATDAIHWRGPDQNGAFPTRTTLPNTWSPDGENLLWKAAYGSRSAPVVHNGRVYLINSAGDDETTQERVLALDLKTGELLWEYRFNVFLTDIVVQRVGWANLTVDPATGNLFAHGIQGLTYCFSPDGEVLWERSLTEEIGRISGYGGRTNSPTIFEDLVILSALTSGWGPHGRGLHRFWAMNKHTGIIQWWSEPSGKPLDTTYATPIIHTIDGRPTLFTGLADGTVASLDPRTGKRLWQFTLSKRGINSSVVYGNGKIYACHSEENIDDTAMGRMVALDAKTGKEIWRAPIKNGYASPILSGTTLYTTDNRANLFCLDAETGAELWKYNYGNEAKGSPVFAEGKIYVGDVSGTWHTLAVSREGCQPLDSDTFQHEDGSPEEIFATPVIAHGKILLPTLKQLFCISTKPATYTEAVAPTKVLDQGSAGPLAHLQIQPAEIDLKPGDKVTFSAVGFDAEGRKTGPVGNPVFTVAGLDGKLADGHTFSGVGTERMQAGVITLTAGDLTSSARVRVLPELPYRENFESIATGTPPPGWITSKLKAVVIEHEGGKVLKKLAERPAPPFARLRCYMTPPIPTGYTVQADMLGQSKKKRFIPDMGLINSRYLLILTGTTERTRKLRLVSWAPVPRILKEIDFPWSADAWYTAKLSVHIEDGVGKVAAKVWPQGEKEPAAWSLTMDDSTPNPAGSPGLYAYSVAITSKTPGTPVLFDNVEIIPHDQ